PLPIPKSGRKISNSLFRTFQVPPGMPAEALMSRPLVPWVLAKARRSDAVAGMSAHALIMLKKLHLAVIAAC
ncbi:hypothetical protein, partial [Kozakia baliensis]|uniref:hypothetical protein n=1 Tax=Kozakia baliensis TaxID=153496 RepID=UPI001C996D73